MCMQFLLHDNAWSNLDAMGTGRACRCDLGWGEGGGGEVWKEGEEGYLTMGRVILMR